MQRYEKSRKHKNFRLDFLDIHNIYLSSITKRPHRKMQPHGTIAVLGRAKRQSRALLNQQLIKVLTALIRVIQQYVRIAYQLFSTQHPDIYRAPRKF